MTIRNDLFVGASADADPLDIIELDDLPSPAPAPKPVPPAAALRSVAEAAGFTDRDPRPAAAPVSRPGAFRTGRNVQLSFRVTARGRDDLMRAVELLSEGQGRPIAQGEAVERALRLLLDSLRQPEG